MYKVFTFFFLLLTFFIKNPGQQLKISGNDFAIQCTHIFLYLEGGIENIDKISLKGRTGSIEDEINSSSIVTIDADNWYKIYLHYKEEQYFSISIDYEGVEKDLIIYQKEDFKIKFFNESNEINNLAKVVKRDNKQIKIVHRDDYNKVIPIKSLKINDISIPIEGTNIDEVPSKSDNEFIVETVSILEDCLKFHRIVEDKINISFENKPSKYKNKSWREILEPNKTEFERPICYCPDNGNLKVTSNISNFSIKVESTNQRNGNIIHSNSNWENLENINIKLIEKGKGFYEENIPVAKILKEKIEVKYHYEGLGESLLLFSSNNSNPFFLPQKLEFHFSPQNDDYQYYVIVTRDNSNGKTLVKKRLSTKGKNQIDMDIFPNEQSTNIEEDYTLYIIAYDIKYLCYKEVFGRLIKPLPKNYEHSYSFNNQQVVQKGKRIVDAEKFICDNKEIKLRSNDKDYPVIFRWRAGNSSKGILFLNNKGTYDWPKELSKNKQEIFVWPCFPYQKCSAPKGYGYSNKKRDGITLKLESSSSPVSERSIEMVKTLASPKINLEIEKDNILHLFEDIDSEKVICECEKGQRVFYEIKGQPLFKTNNELLLKEIISRTSFQPLEIKIQCQPSQEKVDTQKASDWIHFKIEFWDADKIVNESKIIFSPNKSRYSLTEIIEINITPKIQNIKYVFNNLNSNNRIKLGERNRDEHFLVIKDEQDKEVGEKILLEKENNIYRKPEVDPIISLKPEIVSPLNYKANEILLNTSIRRLSIKGIEKGENVDYIQLFEKKDGSEQYIIRIAFYVEDPVGWGESNIIDPTYLREIVEEIEKQTRKDVFKSSSLTYMKTIAYLNITNETGSKYLPIFKRKDPPRIPAWHRLGSYKIQYCGEKNPDKAGLGMDVLEQGALTTPQHLYIDNSKLEAYFRDIPFTKFNMTRDYEVECNYSENYIVTEIHFKSGI